MREVGAFEAKNNFGQLLDWVEQGEEVTITRHGKQVARLVSVCRGFNQAEAAHPRSGGTAPAGLLRVGRVESRPRRRPPVSLVLDSSATLAWIYGEETTEAIPQVFDVVAEDGATVPTPWRLGAANNRTVAARRRRTACPRG